MGWQRVADLGVAVLDARLTTAEGEIDTLRPRWPATRDEGSIVPLWPRAEHRLPDRHGPTPSRAVLDIEGHPIGVYDASNVSYALGSDGVWARTRKSLTLLSRPGPAPRSACRRPACRMATA